MLRHLADPLNKASYLLADVAGELAYDTDSLDADPARLAAVQERRATLNRLVQAYGSRTATRTAAGRPRRRTAPVPPVPPVAPVTPVTSGTQWAGRALGGLARDGIGDLTAVLAWTRIAGGPARRARGRR